MRTQDDPGATLFLRFWQAMEARDEATLRRVVAEDFTMIWPQSGETFTGFDAAVAAMEAREIKPEPAGEPRILGRDDLWVVMLPLRYGEEVHHYVGVFELRDGRVAATTEVFGAPFPATGERASRPED